MEHNSIKIIIIINGNYSLYSGIHIFDLEFCNWDLAFLLHLLKTTISKTDNYNYDFYLW